MFLSLNKQIVINQIKRKFNQGMIFRYFDLFFYTDYRLGAVAQEGLKLI